MALIRTTEEIKQYLPVTAVFDMKDFGPFINKAERWLVKKALGKDLYDALTAAYEADAELEARFADILPLVQEVLANHAYYRYLPHSSIITSKDGTHVYSNDQKKPVPQWLMDEWEEEISDSCFEALEDLLVFLENNQASYSEWVDSAAYTEFNECFITTAVEFSKYQNINNSRRTFLSLKYLIIRAQQSLLLDIFGEDFYNELLSEVATGTISAETTALYKFLGPAVCNQVIADALIELPVIMSEHGTLIDDGLGDSAVAASQAAEARQNRLLKRNQLLEVVAENVRKLEDYLFANADTYPTYKASDEYAELKLIRDEVDPDTLPGSNWQPEDGGTDTTTGTNMINLRGGGAVI
jgi:hypothetical protein